MRIPRKIKKRRQKQTGNEKECVSQCDLDDLCYTRNASPECPYRVIPRDGDPSVGRNSQGVRVTVGGRGSEGDTSLIRIDRVGGRAESDNGEAVCGPIHVGIKCIPQPYSAGGEGVDDRSGSP